MISLGKAAVIYTGLVGATILQTVWYYPQLPARVASHFGVSGVPDGWMSRGAFVTIEAAVAVVVALLMLLMFAIMAFLPLELMNMPRKPHWLAPERRDVARQMVTDFAVRFGVLTQLFMLTGFMLASEANLKPEPRLSEVSELCLWGFLGVTAILATRLIWRFWRVPREAV